MDPRMRICAAVSLLMAAGASAVTVTRGPFLQMQTPESMHVVWMTDVACTGEVEWGLSTAYGQLTSSPATETRHEIEIAGLAPDTLYHYRVRNQGKALSLDATLRTAPADNAQSVTFSFVGDSCSAPANATATYTAMLPHALNGFCMTLGDLAGRGEDNLTDYWKTHFFDPVRDYIKQVCMYTCIGNHEIYDEVSFPDYVYPTKYLANWSQPTASSGSELYYSFDKGPAHFVSLDTWWSSYAAGTAQYNWLVSDLGASTKPWKIVFAHTGPYVSQYGTTDGSDTARSVLVPVLEQRDVDLYLHGHYHDYQRNDVNGVTYIVQGTGGQSLTERADDSQPYVQAYAGGVYCYTRLDIQGSRLLGRCLKTSDGTVIDGWQLDKPRLTMPWQDSFPSAGPQFNWIAPWHYATQCGVVPAPGNPSGDGAGFTVADTSGHQFAYPMAASEALQDYSIRARVHYQADSAAQTRWGIGLRGRLFFDSAKRSYYALCFVRNDPLAANGSCVLLRQNAGVETVLASWAGADTLGWRQLKLSASGNELSVWIDDVLMSTVPISDGTLSKGRPFIYNYRGTGGAKTLVDDVFIDEVAGAALITGFEGFSSGTQAMFRQPSFSSSSSAHLAASPDTARVVTSAAFEGTGACQVDWAFVDTDPKRWLRLTTSGAANVPNPTVDLDRPITFWYRLTTPGSLRVCLGIRETGTDVAIGANGGTSGTIEWLGADALVNGAPQGQLIAYDAGGAWQKLTFDPLADSVQAFTGDGVLNAAHRKGVIEHVGLAVVDGTGPFSLQMDLFQQPWREAATAPAITQQPAPQITCPGGTVSFSVAASGSAPLAFRWQKGGVDLVEGGAFTGTHTAVLGIAGAQPEHVGDYRCVVSNSAGSATSQTAAFTLSPSTLITAQTPSPTVYAGDPVTLSVTATGAGTLLYRWQKNQVDLPADSRYSGETARSLTFTGVSLGDAGTYRCLVTALCNTAASADINLQVLAAYRGDFDRDNDVDQADFSVLQLCLDRQLDAGCAAANLNRTGDINQADVLVFLDCLSGADKPPAAECLY